MKGKLLLVGATLAIAVGVLHFAPAEVAPPATTTATPGSQAAPPGDPMEWREPAAMPALLDPMSDERYQAAVRRMKLPEKFDVAAAKARRPVAVVIDQLHDGEGAATAGIKMGDIIAGVDGDPIFYDWDFQARMQQPGQRTLAVVTGDEVPRQVKLAFADSGFFYRTVWFAQSAWALSPARDPKLDTFIRVAAAKYDTDPDLALAALCRAQRAGWNGKNAGYVPLALAACALFRQCSFTQMLPFGALALKQDMPLKERTLLIGRMRIGAVAEFKLPYWIELGKMSDDLLPAPELQQEISKAIASWRQLPARPYVDLTEDVKNYDFKDLSRQIDSAYKGKVDEWHSEEVVNVFRNNNALIWSAPPGEYHKCVIGPTGNNVDVSMDFKFEPSPGPDKGFGKDFVFGLLVDHQDGSDSAGEGAVVTLFDSGQLSVSHYIDEDYQTTPDHSPRFEHNFRIIALDQRLEVILDGRRILYAPVTAPEHDRKYCLLIKCVGIGAEMKNIVWRTAGERKKP